MYIACANEISPSSCRLFNLSLELGTFPEKWKDANLVPIHKCESKTMVSNYRGISLLDVLSKILERQVYNDRQCYLPASYPLAAWISTRKIHCVSAINSLTLLRGDSKLMLFI